MNPSSTTAPLPAELRLVLAALRPGDVPNHATTPAVAESINWDYLLGVAEWHDVLPLVSRKLGDLAAVPDLVQERCQQASFATAVRNLHIASLVAHIASSFELAGIPVISYKGVVLSQLLYGSTALRPVADIDFIIHPEHFKPAVSLLAEQGFADRFGFTEKQRSAVFHLSFEHGFQREGAHIDVHWRIVQRFVWPSLSMDQVWNSLEDLSFFGNNLRVFSPDLMLAALCVHAAQDEWIFLKSFADIAQLIRSSPQLDWDKFLHWFGDSHSRRSMAVALQLAQDHLGAELPAEVTAVIESDTHAQSLAKWVASQWSARSQPVPEQAQVSQWLFHTRGESTPDRARYVAGVLLRPTLEDFRTASFPNSMRWLYFAVRPFRIARERFGRRRQQDRARESTV